jgi:hypothetical protein
VVTRNFMLLATFFVQPDPSSASLHEMFTQMSKGIGDRTERNCPFCAMLALQTVDTMVAVKSTFLAARFLRF